MRNRRMIFLLSVMALFFVLQGTAFAEVASENRSIFSAGTGLGGTFDDALGEIGEGLVGALNVVMFCLTVASFLMWSMGIEDEKKLLWQVMLGLGLAWNFGGAILSLGFDFEDSSAAVVQQYEFHLKSDIKSFDLLGAFLQNFINNVVVPGAANILPYCKKILLILAVIQGTWDLSFKFHGDKVQFLLSKVLQIGFYLYLMDKWIWLMTALGDGFEMIGYLAAGLTGTEASEISGDGIVGNAIKIFFVFYDKAEFSLSSPGLMLINVIGMIAVLLCLVLTAIELTVAKIEFYTFALMTLPLLAFGVTEKFKFLFEKAIGAMVNLAVKVSVITFICGMAGAFILSFAKDMEASKDTISMANLGILLQTVLAALLIYWITKSIPALASGLLNGQPSLGGAGMMQQMMAPVAAAGMVREAGKRANEKGSGGVKGTLMELGKAAVNSQMPVQAFRGGRQRLRQLNEPQIDSLKQQRRELTDVANREADVKYKENADQRMKENVRKAAEKGPGGYAKKKEYPSYLASDDDDKK